jgi:hypothetical protein
MSNDSPMVKLLGPSLLSKVGKKVSTVDAFRDKELVIFYFSGRLLQEKNRSLLVKSDRVT